MTIVTFNLCASFQLLEPPLLKVFMTIAVVVDPCTSSQLLEAPLLKVFASRPRATDTSHVFRSLTAFNHLIFLRRGRT